ncbi:WD repeat-containing protein 70 [Balamuthia mandrillaris]
MEPSETSSGPSLAAMVSATRALAEKARSEDGDVPSPSALFNEQGYVVFPDQRKSIVASAKQQHLRQDGEEDEENEEGEQALEKGEDREEFPITHEIVLRGHHKGITCLALDPSGSRLLTGGSDYAVRFWDFAGMDSSLRAFRTVEPSPGYPVHSLSYSPSGHQFVVATGTAAAKLFDRDGFEQAELARGDMYLADMARTKGHISTVSRAVWHPVDKDMVMTAGLDSTVRLWDVNDPSKQQTVIKFKDVRNKTRLPILTCEFEPKEGGLIGAGGEDGSLWIWPTAGPFSRPSHLLREAHGNYIEHISLSFSTDGRTLISRASDDTMKVWDLRRFKQPLKVFSGLKAFSCTSCVFSPDDQFIVTGTSVRRDETASSLLLFYDKTSLELIKQIGVSQGGSAQSILWHPRINQIVVGTGDAAAHVYYDPKRSHNGALLCAGRRARRQDISDVAMELNRPIVTPHALPIFKDAEPTTSKRKRMKERQDPIRSHKPDLPAAQGPGYGGRIGSSLTHHLMKSLIKKTDREEDPREAILKYAEKAAEDPYWFRAYTSTQPVPVYDYEALKEEEEKAKQQAGGSSDQK